MNGQAALAHLAYIGPGAGFAFLGSFLALVASLAASAVALCLLPFRLLRRALVRRKAGGRARVRKLVFLGLDGLDPTLTERFMDEGKMPNLERLRAQGGYRRLRTTYPALSPVAWSTFATGVNPGRHNIFDFLNRDLRSYAPLLSAARVSPPRRTLRLGPLRIPLSAPSIEMRRKSEPFWTILGRYFIPCTILRVPVTFPPDRFRGRLLSAMPAPDLRGTQGEFSFFTTDRARRAGDGGVVSMLERERDGYAGSLSGPANPFTVSAEPLRVRFHLRPNTGDAGYRLEIEGHSYALQPGAYTPWVRLRFRPGVGPAVHGIARFLLTEASPDVELYVTPLQLDPERPALPISQPRSFAVFLAKLLGTYSTLGLAEDTWALNEGAIGEDAFLAQAASIQSEREAMFFQALERARGGVVACVFDTSDRVQHMFFRHLDNAASPHAGVIEALYRDMDRLAGETLRRAGAGAAVFILSDHGFRRFERGVNLNSWLLRNGYLALETGRDEGGDYLEGIDWERTRAYSFGLGGLYLNQRGREARGSVAPEDAPPLIEELASRLSGLRDEETGAEAIRKAYPASSLYQGPYTGAAPDLIVGYAEGFRASWDGAKGKVTRRIFEPNDKAWSGDHCVDPELVPGVLFSNLPLDAADPGIEDLAPTALELFGVPRPPWMEGQPVAGVA